MEPTIMLLSWAERNINNNLDFVPDDKLNWKPAPEAKSVLEIINHMTGTVDAFTSGMQKSAKTEMAPVTNRDEAKARISQVIQAHIAHISALSPVQLDEVVSTPVGELPARVAAALPVVETINHHGQITYIQEMLGDTESHLLL